MADLTNLGIIGFIMTRLAGAVSRIVSGTVPCAASLVLFVILTTSYASARELVEPAAATESEHPGAAKSEIVAERPVWKRVTLGGYRGVNALRAALDAAGVRVGDMADEILGRPAFSFSRIEMTIDLDVLTARDLGFTQEASLSDIYARATQLGFALCPGEAAALLRLAYREQPVGEFLRIAMKPVATYGGTPVALTVANGGTKWRNRTTLDRRRTTPRFHFHSVNEVCVHAATEDCFAGQAMNGDRHQPHPAVPTVGKAREHRGPLAEQGGLK